jgi:hypothetical protein
VSAERVQPTPESPSGQAIVELQGMIHRRYPSAQFHVRSGIDDPETSYLVATVDVDDPDEVLDLVLDRLLQLQVDDGLAIAVLPIHTPARVQQTMRQVSERRPFKGMPALPVR